MKYVILMLGAARDCAEAERIEVELPGGSTVGDLRSKLAESSPPIAKLLPSCAIAVEYRYRSDTDILEEADLEIAVVPPVSGG